MIKKQIKSNNTDAYIKKYDYSVRGLIIKFCDHIDFEKIIKYEYRGECDILLFYIYNDNNNSYNIDTVYQPSINKIIINLHKQLTSLVTRQRLPTQIHMLKFDNKLNQIMQFDIEGKIIFGVSLCEKYNTNDDIKYLLGNREYFNKKCGNANIYNYISITTIEIEIEIEMNNNIYNKLIFCGLATKYYNEMLYYHTNIKHLYYKKIEILNVLFILLLF